MHNREVERFDDLVAWEKARGLTREIHSVTAEGKFGEDFGLSNETRRVCVDNLQCRRMI